VVNVLSERPLIFVVTWDEISSFNRLDVKHIALSLVFKDVREAIPKQWENLGFSVVRLDDVVRPVERPVRTGKLPKQHLGLPLLSVTFEGKAIPRAKKLKRKVEMAGLTTKYPVLFKVSTGDIVLSRIDIVNGAVAVVPEDLNGYLVSREFIVLRIKKDYEGIIDPYYVWAYLRSDYVREYVRGMMRGVTGRHRIKWEQLKKIPFPLPESEEVRSIVSKHIEDLKESLKELEEALTKYNNAIRGLHEILST